MLKKVILLVLFLLTTAPGDCSALIGVKTGYFFFTDAKMRKIYDRGGLDVQLIADYPLWDLSCGWTLNGYGAIEYWQRSGRSLHGHQKTSLWSIPVNIGLKPVYAIHDDLNYYLAAGPRYFYLHQHNHSSYVEKNRSRNGLGLFVNTGFNYRFCECWNWDMFGEYSYAQVRFSHGKSHVYTQRVQIGGFTLGGGLEYAY